MRFRFRPNHMVDFLFPLMLFFVFAISALSVIFLAAGIYQSVTENSSQSHTARTTLAYISEKLHQSDAEGEVSLSRLDDCEAIQIRQTINETVYCTYIYAYDGELRELFVKEGTDVSPQSGSFISRITSLTIEEPADGLFRFVCPDADGQEQSLLIHVRSENAERSTP